MQIQVDQHESNKETVNHAIRICVNCGNTAVLIQNRGIFCKECGVSFEVEDKK